MIEINLTKKYGERLVLDVQLTFEKGKKYALIGANGSGKSTLLKLISKIEKPTSGSTDSIKDNDICYMTQTSYAFDMSLKSNIFIACPTFKEKVFYNDRVYSLISKMGLWDLRYKNASKLSGGETQRMALARSLVQKHDILLLDEPTSAMDLGATAIAERVLSEYYLEYSPTIIFATHSIKQAERFADYVIFLKDGKVKEIADAKDFISNPQSEELKAFLNQA